MTTEIARFPASYSVEMNADARILSVTNGYVVAMVDKSKPLVTRRFRDSGAKCIGSYLDGTQRKFLFE